MVYVNPNAHSALGLYGEYGRPEEIIIIPVETCTTEILSTTSITTITFKHVHSESNFLRW